LCDTLEILKSKGKKLFLASNSAEEYMEFIMAFTLGKKDWKQYFDISIANTSKPLFYKT
jgi:FMN phosphatase YigB (HAD superfamily)